MQQKFKDWLIQYAESKSYDTDDDSLMEIIMEAGDEISSETVSSHRWYDNLEVVVKLEDKFVKYNTFYTTGDSHYSDMGLKHNLEDCEEVEPYEVTVTKYRYKDQ